MTLGGTDMNQLVIKPFEEQYIEEALKIYNHYILNSTATFSVEPLDEEAFKKIVFSGLKRFPSYALLEEGELVGYGLLNRYKPREAYDKTAEVTIYLKASCIGKGYGRQTLEYIEEKAREFNHRALLAVICAENESSVKLFGRAGYFQCAHFKQVGEKFNRILDVLIYEKLL